jgi:hypothetical protein
VGKVAGSHVVESLEHGAKHLKEGEIALVKPSHAHE